MSPSKAETTGHDYMVEMRRESIKAKIEMEVLLEGERYRDITPEEAYEMYKSGRYAWTKTSKI